MASETAWVEKHSSGMHDGRAERLLIPAESREEGAGLAFAQLLCSCGR